MTADARSDSVHSKALPDVIAKLLMERQEMLVLFSRLAELKPYTQVPAAPTLLQRFCQVMMDYVAMGHFEVYQCIEESAGGRRCCRRVRRLARELYPRIARTTQSAIDFNDRYDNCDRGARLSGLSRDLSELGEYLATRIELEDRLIAAIKAA